MDEIDLAQDRERIATEAAVRQIQNKEGMPKGKPGDCELCGEWSARLVEGVCAPCRDRFKLP